MEDDACRASKGSPTPRDGQVRIDLVTPDGRYDRAAILRDAHYHQYGAMRRHGWSWSRCLSFSWARARAMQERAQLAASGEEEDGASALAQGYRSDIGAC
jgi:hypothetical protein